MAHPDEELLGLLALGERDATAAESRHLDSCAACRGILDGFQRTVSAARVDPGTVPLVRPGGHNWAAIHERLCLPPSLAADPLAAARTPSLPRAVPPAGSPPRQAAGGRSRRAPWLLGAAAGLLLGAAAAWMAWNLLGPSTRPAAGPAGSGPATTPGPSAALIGEAVLTPLGGHSAHGTALVEQLPDGTRQVVVNLSEEKLTGFREVWLGSADLSRMVSLGVLGQGSQAFVLPGGLDLAAYPVLDVSDEPYDGDPAHSADSLARGKLSLQG